MPLIGAHSTGLWKQRQRVCCLGHSTAMIHKPPGCHTVMQSSFAKQSFDYLMTHAWLSHVMQDVFHGGVVHDGRWSKLIQDGRLGAIKGAVLHCTALYCLPLSPALACTALWTLLLVSQRAHPEVQCACLLQPLRCNT